LKHIYPKLDWTVLRSAAVCAFRTPLTGPAGLSRRLAPQATLGLEGLPEVVAPEMLESDTFLRAFHHVLLEARARSRRAATARRA
jgi:hypothetical protein